MYLIKADPSAEGQAEPPAGIIEEMTAYNEQLNEAGVLLAADGFLPTAVDSFRITYGATEADAAVTPGPFDIAAETHVCGFWIVRTKDAEEAVAWAKRVPFRQGELVVRRLADSADFGDLLSEDVKNREAKLAEDMAKRSRGEI
jgi:hypothetical protein